MKFIFNLLWFYRSSPASSDAVVGIDSGQRHDSTEISSVDSGNSFDASDRRLHGRLDYLQLGPIMGIARFRSAS